MKKTQQGNVMAILLTALVAAFVVWVGFYIHNHRKVQSNDLGLGGISSTLSGNLPSDNSDQSLNDDLQNINTGLNQGNQNLQNSNSSLNDQQLPITE